MARPKSTEGARKPIQNAFVENFNGRMREKYLNETLFFDIDVRAPRSRPGFPTIMASARTRRSNAVHLRPKPPTSTASGDRLRNPGQFGLSPVTPPAPFGGPETPTAAG